MKSVDLDQKLKQTEGELKRHEQEIADQDEVHRPEHINTFKCFSWKFIHS